MEEMSGVQGVFMGAAPPAFTLRFEEPRQAPDLHLRFWPAIAHAIS
jgi:hypothetical protein